MTLEMEWIDWEDDDEDEGDSPLCEEDKAEARGMGLMFDRWAAEGDWRRFRLYLQDIATPGEFRDICLGYMQRSTFQMVRRFETAIKLEKLLSKRKTSKRPPSKGFG
jgi:hypothetical protein